MVNTKLNLSMTEPYVRQIYAKEGDTGRVLEIGVEDYPTENGTLRILRPDGVEKTSDAESSVSPTITDGMATFDSLEEAEVTELKIALSPKQDLHGYANPWVGGAGKNLLKTYDSWSTTPPTTKNADGSLSVIGEKTGSNNAYNIGVVTLPTGTYALSKGGGTGDIYFQAQANGSTIANTQNGDTTFTLSAETEVTFRIFIRAGVTYNAKLYPQVEVGTSSTAYAPYSNICPIYPSNGKNLIDADTVWSAYRQDDGTFVNPLGTTHYSIPQSLVGKELTFSAKVKANSSSANCRVSASIGGSTKNGNLVNTTDSFTLTSLTITPTSTSDYLVLQSSGDNGTYKEIQLELGSTTTPYVPYQGINLYQQGKNVLPNDLTWTSGLRNDSGTQTSSSVSHYSSPFPVRPSTQYTLQGLLYNTTNYRAYYLDANCGWISRSTSLGNQIERITTPENCYYMQVQCANELDLSSNAQIEEGATATTIEPYNGTTYPLSLGRDVYGGTLDVVSGKLVVDTAFETITSFDGKSSATTVNSYYSGGLANSAIYGEEVVSNMFPYKENIWQTTEPVIGFANDTLQTIRVSFPLSSDVDTLAKANALIANGLQFAYKISTPIVYQLTPTQISTLLGENNVWSDGEITELTFDYGKLLSVLTADQTAVVGRCLGDVNFNGASTMPFTLVVKPNNKEQA